MEFGYSSSSDFARAFKAAYAASPSEFQARPSPRALLRAGSGVAEGMAARTTRLPDLSLAFVRVFGLSRDHKSAMIEEAFARLYRCLAARGTAGGLVLGLTMDPPETLAFDRCRYYACIEARDGSGIEDEVSVARFPTAGDYACVDVPPGPGPAAPRFFGACAYLVDSWMPERRLESADRPFIELFSEAGTPCWRLLVPIAGKARNA
jgi:DNA gyrase inhibitor GyrI